MGNRILAERYEILEKIGEGGMAVVYKAKDRLLGRHVAIKILRPEYIKDQSFIESFNRESQAAGSISHPNIVNIYDVGQEGNVHYIVMELVEGRTLSEVIDEEAPLEYKRAINIAKQIASALALAHKNNIIHRDVKPHNILITEDDQAKITDFGIAKAVTDATLVGEPTTIMGSVHYFSPEQARGGYIDEKSDIYSLGIVLYEMLTGRVPFDADSPVAVAVKHMNVRPEPPSRLVQGIPPGLEQIVLKAIDKYQINRFKSADDMYKALDNVNFITGIVDGADELGLKDTPSYYDDEDDEEITEIPEDDDIEEPLQEMPTKKELKESKKKEKKKFRKYKVLAVLLAIVLALPTSYGIYTGVNYLMNNRSVEVPEVLGMTETKARQELEDKGLELEVVEEVVSEDYGPGEIVSQDPKAGTKVKKGYTVKVNISEGRTGEVPNVIGKTQKDAEYILKQYGYEIGDITFEDSEQPANTVIRTSPEAGEEARAGDEVNLVISKGGNELSATVPKLIGMTEAQAKAALEKVGLTLGTVTRENHDSYAKDTIMWQQYASGEEIPSGSSVSVKISNGPASGPKSVYIKIDFSSAPSEVFNLSVALTKSNGSVSYVINNQSREKSKGSETVKVTGEGTGKVTVYFNDSLVRTYNVNFDTGTVG